MSLACADIETEEDMSVLAKLDLKTVTKQVESNPVQKRRNKLIEKLTEQIAVWKAEKAGEKYTRTAYKMQMSENGTKERVEVKLIVRPIYFKQDGGWYVQCRYGSKVLSIYGRSNAVYVSKFDEVKGVIETLIEAVKEGEFDKAMQQAAARK